MKIALLHFHLKRGGVTSVIRHQVEAIQSLGWDPLVLVGEPPEEAFPCDVRTIEGLAYDRFLFPGLTADGIADSVTQALRCKWAEGPDVLHVHNPTLAKNSHLQNVLKKLQRSGMVILCQIHDFAEDGRPDAYFRIAYLGDCHYAAINPRDHQLLLNAGLRAEGCHLLPNAVTIAPAARDNTFDQYGVLYPVRAIRRKNIGEAILLSLFFHDREPLKITLPPNSPDDMKCYHRWKAFVGRHELPVHFDAGLNADFSSLLAQCRYVITTSITEGFGFTFLEPWAVGKRLWGRSLPDICQGFMRHGLRLDWLYNCMQVPLAWLDRDRLKSRWESAMAEAHHHFALTFSSNNLESAWQTVSANGCIDYGLLDEPFQEQVIQRVLNAPSDREALMQVNPFLNHPGPPENHEAIVVMNRQVIDRHYRPVAYAKRLKIIYRRASSVDIRHHLDKAFLAKAFLSPHGFSLLKWGNAHG